MACKLECFLVYRMHSHRLDTYDFLHQFQLNRGVEFVMQISFPRFVPSHPCRGLSLQQVKIHLIEYDS